MMRDEELMKAAKLWADRFRDNGLSWEQHGDDLGDAADLIDLLLALIARCAG